MMTQDQENAVKWLGGLCAVAGAWLIISPFILGAISTSVYWNQIVVGALAVILGLVQLSAPRSSWASWVMLIAAIWLIASPYIFNPLELSSYVNAVISGLVLGVLALSGGIMASSNVAIPTESGRPARQVEQS